MCMDASMSSEARRALVPPAPPTGTGLVPPLPLPPLNRWRLAGAPAGPGGRPMRRRAKPDTGVVHFRAPSSGKGAMWPWEAGQRCTLVRPCARRLPERARRVVWPISAPLAAVVMGELVSGEHAAQTSVGLFCGCSLSKIEFGIGSCGFGDLVGLGSARCGPVLPTPRGPLHRKYTKYAFFTEHPPAGRKTEKSQEQRVFECSHVCKFGWWRAPRWPTSTKIGSESIKIGMGSINIGPKSANFG